MSSLLARFAENSFWLARYMERAENLARILNVNLVYAANNEDVGAWLPVVQLLADGERFFEVHEEADAAAVLHWYVLDSGNPTSILAEVAMARENARALRHLISTEAWTHLNVFHDRLRQLRRRDIALPRLAALTSSIKEDCQLHTGIVEGTFYRDQVWYFHALGKWVERADQTTRLLDINHHHLNTAMAGAASPETRHWQALLRSVAGFHAFRRVHPRGVQPVRVIDFLLFDPAFPRSVSACTGQIAEVMAHLEALPELADVAMPLSELRSLQAQLAVPSIDEVLALGLHAVVDRIQSRLIAFTEDLGRTFFGHMDNDVSASQRQAQDALSLPPAGQVQRAPGDDPAARQP